MSKNKRIIVMCLITFLLFLAMPLLASTSGDKCTSSGTKEYKYTASGCDTVTNARTCCGNGYYSNWDSSCQGADNCGPGQCYGSSGTCSGTPPVGCSCTNGTCTRSWTCTQGTGWSYKDSVCTCKSGYVMENGVCTSTADCIEIKSFSYHYSTCSQCWNGAKGMTSGVPKCTADSSASNCYVLQNSSGYESVTRECPTDSLSYGQSAGGNTALLTMRYNHGVAGTNCYFENVKYKKC